MKQDEGKFWDMKLDLYKDELVFLEKNPDLFFIISTRQWIRFVTRTGSKRGSFMRNEKYKLGTFDGHYLLGGESATNSIFFVEEYTIGKEWILEYGVEQIL